MARYWTWTEIKAQVELELDIQDELFVTDDELLAYANEAIDEAEAEIHAIYEDYFLSRAYISLVSGTEGYTLPSDIYAQKIRSVMYSSGSTVYEIQRIRDWRKFEEYTMEAAVQSSTMYKYMLINSTAGQPQILLSPAAKETSSQVVRIWYLRNANRLSTGSDVCDIPEFVSFVMAYIRYKVLAKEGNPMMEAAGTLLEQQREQMTATLQTRTPDSNNEIEADRSHYEEHT
jgi:hypothetical protein